MRYRKLKVLNKTENPSKDALDKTDVSTYPNKETRPYRQAGMLTRPSRMTRPTRVNKTAGLNQINLGDETLQADRDLPGWADPPG